MLSLCSVIGLGGKVFIDSYICLYIAGQIECLAVEIKLKYQCFVSLFGIIRCNAEGTYQAVPRGGKGVYNPGVKCEAVCACKDGCLLHVQYTEFSL